MEIIGRIADLFVRHSGKIALENIKISVLDPKTKKPLTLAGNMPPCAAGDLFRFQVSDKTTYYQIESVELYDVGELGATFVLRRWFGESAAQNIADQFKTYEGALKVFYRNPLILEKLQSIPAHEIRQGLRKAALDWVLCSQLYSIIHEWGVQAEYLVPLAMEVGPTWSSWFLKNPYAGMKYGLEITFCDRYAREVLNWPTKHPFRGFAIVRSVMQNLVSRGQHVVPFQDVVTMCSLIDKEKTFSFDAVVAALSQVKRNPEDHPAIQYWGDSLQMITNTPKGNLLQLQEIANDEQMIAMEVKRLKGLFKGDVPQIQDTIKSLEAKREFTLHREQVAAITALAQANLAIVIGRSGSGKTTVLTYLADLITELNRQAGGEDVAKSAVGADAPANPATATNDVDASHGAAAEANADEEQSHEPVLMTFHGNAAKRLAQLSGRRVITYAEFSTKIWRKPITLLVDEAQCFDRNTMAFLLLKLPKGSRAVFFGDVEQLLPVTHSNPLRDMTISGEIPTVVLRFFHPPSGIGVEWANQFLVRKMPEIQSATVGPTGQIVQMVDLKNGQVAAIHRIKDTFSQTAKQQGKDDVVVLTAQQEGPFGSIKLNTTIQDHWNPADPQKVEWKIGSQLIRSGDRVRLTTAQPKLGLPQYATGWITQANATHFTIDWTGYQAITYGRSEALPLELAYALPMHTAYGFQWGYVIYVAMPEIDQSLNRRALYTAFSRCRGKMLLCMIVDGVANVLTQGQEQETVTWLVQRLKQLK